MFKKSNIDILKFECFKITTPGVVLTRDMLKSTLKISINIDINKILAISDIVIVDVDSQAYRNRFGIIICNNVQYLIGENEYNKIKPRISHLIE